MNEQWRSVGVERGAPVRTAWDKALERSRAFEFIKPTSHNIASYLRISSEFFYEDVSILNSIEKKSIVYVDFFKKRERET